MFSRRKEWQEAERARNGHGRALLGLALVTAGVIWGAGRLGWSITAIEWSAIAWPAVVVVIGVLVLMRGRYHRPRITE